MRRLVLISIAAALIAACSSSDFDERARAPRARPGLSGEARSADATAGGGLELMLPPRWWQDEETARAANLSTEQIASLDRIVGSRDEDLRRLQSGSDVALRDLRRQLDADKPLASEIVTAGERVRALRDEVFTAQLGMLADERALLTRQQWQAVQDSLEERRSRRRDRGGDGGYGRPGSRGSGGRGGIGGRGARRPGWGY